ncbi:hypothetical protein YC2023_110640 [Brassica napus]
MMSQQPYVQETNSKTHLSRNKKLIVRISRPERPVQTPEIKTGGKLRTTLEPALKQNFNDTKWNGGGRALRYIKQRIIYMWTAQKQYYYREETIEQQRKFCRYSQSFAINWVTYVNLIKRKKQLQVFFFFIMNQKYSKRKEDLMVEDNTKIN